MFLKRKKINTPPIYILTPIDENALRVIALSNSVIKTISCSNINGLISFKTCQNCKSQPLYEFSNYIWVLNRKFAINLYTVPHFYLKILIEYKSPRNDVLILNGIGLLYNVSEVKEIKNFINCFNLRVLINRYTNKRMSDNPLNCISNCMQKMSIISLYCNRK